MHTLQTSHYSQKISLKMFVSLYYYILAYKHFMSNIFYTYPIHRLVKMHDLRYFMIVHI